MKTNALATLNLNARIVSQMLYERVTLINDIVSEMRGDDLGIYPDPNEDGSFSIKTFFNSEEDRASGKVDEVKCIRWAKETYGMTIADAKQLVSDTFVILKQVGIK